MEFLNYLLPEEAGEMTLAQVARLRQIEQRLRLLFETAKYQEVMPPNFEYVELYDSLKTGFASEKMFQFINHEGKSIALRYDFTIPLARTYAQSGEFGLTRYAYFGKVFRKERRHKGRRTESYQIGVELLGGTKVDTDRECLDLILKAIEKLPLSPVILELGSADFFKRLCELVGNHASELTELLSKKNLSGMKRFVEENQFSPSFSRLLTELSVNTDLTVLSNLVQETLDEPLITAVRDLIEIAEQLDVVIDFGMVPAMHYYTGLMFKAYSDKVAQPLISGGRYDDLLTQFHCESSAIGFCCHMDNILKAWEQEVQND